MHAPPIHASSKDVFDVEPHHALRCLACGYPLQPGGKLRCSECGKQFTMPTLARWFDGDGEAHLKVINTLVLIVLTLKLWVLVPNLAVLARLGDAAMAAWACAMSRQNKEGSLGAIFGMAGAIAAGAGVLFAFGSTLEFYTLNLVAAPLLVCAVLHDPEIGDVLGRSATRTVGVAIVIVAPLLAAALYFLERVAPANAGPPGASFVLKTLIPHLLATAGWAWAWWSLRHVRRTLYAPLEESE
ncbi:hypothetical protein RAS1_19850 [Phycisphaerae bacterium RAS1]|nr:hypothetical protein RAS1_19850 [Phycisphaerae bacterium RAS1]